MTIETHPTVREIAEGLSEAIVRRLMSSRADARQMGGFGLIYDASGNYRHPPLVERDGMNHPIFGSHWRLTELGLAVRALLAQGPSS